MKCLSCGTDHKLKERLAAGGRCRNCGHEFAFEPTSIGGPAITDRMFASLVEQLSANQTIYFTSKHLFYGLQARLDKQARLTLAGQRVFALASSLLLTIIGAAGLSLAWIGLQIFSFVFANDSRASLANRLHKLSSVQFLSLLAIGIGVWNLLLPRSHLLVFEPFFLVGFGGMIIALIRKRHLQPFRECWIGLDFFLHLLRRWTKVNGAINTLLSSAPSPVLPPGAPAKQLGTHEVGLEPPPDVTAYSFDRLIVCDQEEMVQFLLANHFHFEHNCAILSIGGYPREIFTTTLAMVKRNPSLRVYALHDCSPRGMRVSHQLRTEVDWFCGEPINIVDLGILPRQVLKNPAKMFVRRSDYNKLETQSLPMEIRRHLQPDELAWLAAGYFVELASIPPKRLLQILRRSLLETQELNSDQEGRWIMVGAAATDGSADSFG